MKKKNSSGNRTWVCEGSCVYVWGEEGHVTRPDVKAFYRKKKHRAYIISLTNHLRWERENSSTWIYVTQTMNSNAASSLLCRRRQNTIFSTEFLTLPEFKLHYFHTVFIILSSEVFCLQGCIHTTEDGTMKHKRKRRSSFTEKFGITTVWQNFCSSTFAACMRP